jgi:hypothetical protein
MEVNGQLHALGKWPQYHWKGGWVGLIADLDTVKEKNLLALPGIEPRQSIP